MLGELSLAEQSGLVVGWSLTSGRAQSVVGDAHLPPPHDSQLLLRRPRERAVEDHEVQRARANVLTDAEVQHVKHVEAGRGRR